MASESNLFKPLKVGPNELGHRLVLAPLTRFRASDSHVPLPMVAEYYEQRARSIPGTMLITEATFISPRGAGFKNVPGLYTQEQLEGWKAVTKAVHHKGGYIWCQLWALGRAANPQVIEKEEGSYGVVSASAIPMADNAPVPRELKEDEIQQMIQDYATAAKNAIEVAGFDGVEIHGANGYLVDQFNQDVSNKRTDKWGGSVENRARFALEVSKAVTAAVGKERTGIRLSPWSTFQGMRMENPVPQFTYIVKGLKELGLAYVHIVESRIMGNADVEAFDLNTPFIDAWFEGGSAPGPVLIAGGFKPDSAKRAVDEDHKGRDVAVVFGRLWIANPDLPFRIREGIDLVKYDRDTFYIPKSEKGYTDQPFSEEFLKQQGSKL